MKCFYVIVLLLFSFSIHSQEESTSLEETDSTYSFKKDTLNLFLSSYDIYIGKKLLGNSPFNKVNSIDNFSIENPISYIGIGYSGRFIVSRKDAYEGHIIYNQIIPQKISVDTLNLVLSGFSFALAYGKALFSKNKKNSLIFSFGLNTGRIKLKNSSLDLYYKNLFLSPKFSLQPKTKVGKSFVSLIIDYEYDISKHKWKERRKNNFSYSFTKASLSGVTVLFSLAFPF